MAKPSFPARISRQQVFYSILLSYLVMLVIPTVMSLLGYVYSSQMLHREALAVQQGLLEQVKLQLDQRTQRIYDYNELVASNAQLLRVAAYDESADGQKLFDYVDTQALVRNTTVSLPSNIKATIYLRRSNSFITSTRRYRSEVSDAYATQLGMTPDVLRALAGGGEYRGYTLLSAGVQPAVAFTRSIYADITREPLGKVITFMPVQDLSDALGALVWADQSDAVILSPQGVVAASHGVDTAAFPAYGALPVDGTMLYQAMDGVPHALASIASGATDWRYCVSIPTQVFACNLSVYRLVLAVEIGLCVLLWAYCLPSGCHAPNMAPSSACRISWPAQCTPHRKGRAGHLPGAGGGAGKPGGG